MPPPSPPSGPSGELSPLHPPRQPRLHPSPSAPRKQRAGIPAGDTRAGLLQTLHPLRFCNKGTTLVGPNRAEQVTWAFSPCLLHAPQEPFSTTWAGIPSGDTRRLFHLFPALTASSSTRRSSSTAGSRPADTHSSPEEAADSRRVR